MTDRNLALLMFALTPAALVGGLFACDDQVAYSGGAVVDEPDADGCRLGEQIGCDCPLTEDEGTRSCEEGGFFGPCQCPDGPEPAARLGAEPESIEFGDHPVGEVITARVAIVNEGDAAAVGAYSLDGPAAFTISEGDGLIDLDPGERMGIGLRFAPEAAGGFFGDLVLLYNDDQVLSVPIGALSSEEVPCIFIEPETLVFGASAVGQATGGRVALTNCAERTPVEVRVDESAIGAAFRVTSDRTLTIGPGEVGDVEVVFVPEQSGEHTGTLRLETNDPDNLLSTIALSGRAFSPGECPVARAGARLGDEGPLVPSLTIEGRGTVELDGSGSFDPDNPDDPDAIALYGWSIIDSPQTSTARPLPSDSVVSPQLTLDVPGRYTIELVVTDSEGQPSCEAAQVVVVVRPEGGLSVTLTWETPEDPIPGDDRSGDLDLHLMHPEGRWDTSPWDCHWQNPSPNWGASDRSEDDPRLNRDALARGPEIIALDEPEMLTYTVGVHYGRDNGFGPSLATLEVHLGGVLVFTMDKVLTDPQFWEVVEVDWRAFEVEEIDEVFPDVP